MSGGTACSCARHRSERLLVIDRKCNHSAFNGGRLTRSDYSSVICSDCRRIWRTKAHYVGVLDDLDREVWTATDVIRAVEPAHLWRAA